MLAALLGPLDYMFGETLTVAITVAIILAIVFAVSARFNRWSFDRTARTWLWVTSLAVIWLFTQHSPFRGEGRTIDLNPFGDLKMARVSDSRRDLVLANVALFMPFGMAAAWRGYRFVKAVAVGIVLSLVAETLQYVVGRGRIAQLDDVIFNALGAAAGWIVFAAVRASLKSEGGVPSEVKRGAG